MGEQIKNKSSVIAGTISGIVTLCFLPEVFQMVISLLFGIGYTMNYFLIFPYITLAEISSVSLSAAIFSGFAPFFYLLLVCETGSFFLKKTYPGFYRYSLIIFLLVNLGYILFFTFLNAISLALELNFLNDWLYVFRTAEIPYPKFLLYVFVIIVIIAVYLNLLTKRIMKFVNVQG